jgi:hypothetical protein
MPDAPPLLKASLAKRIKIDGEERFLKKCGNCGAESYLPTKQTRCENCQKRKK